MAWPPVVPPATRANATPLLDTHPADHNAISAALTDLVTRVNPTVWAALPPGAGITTPAGNNPAMYRRVGDITYLRGYVAVDNAATHLVLGTVPAGFRHVLANAITFLAWAFITPSATRIDVTNAGVVTLGGGMSGAIGYLSLDGISWSVTA